MKNASQDEIAIFEQISAVIGKRKTPHHSKRSGSFSQIACCFY